MSLYAASGVDTAAGDRAVELMKASVSATHSADVLGGVGGFAGLFDVSALKSFDRPVLATSTDGVGTKIEIARALDKHDTIGQDLVAMVVDDIVVVGAKPLFMTDYIATGKVVPDKIAAIVGGIARACSATGTSLVGGEVAEHPDVLEADEYDVAGAAVGAVDFGLRLDPALVRDGDAVLAMASSGLHSNGYSLVRKIVADRGVALSARIEEFGSTLGEQLLTPTRLYTTPVLTALDGASDRSGIHMLSHVTGGGIAANLARVLPGGAWVEVQRSAWSPQAVFRVLAEWGGFRLEDVEDTWNLGIGMIAIVAEDVAAETAASLTSSGVPTWRAGTVSTAARPLDGFTQGTKGISAGAVRLVGSYA